MTHIKKTQTEITSKKFTVFCNDPNNTVIYCNNLKSDMVKANARKGATWIDNPLYKEKN